MKLFHAMDSLVASTIRFARPGSRIEIGVGSRAGKATIWLRTDGSGISAGALRSMFNPFRKSRSTRPGVQGGTALALAKAKRIIEAHGGATHVHAGEARELTINVTLPLPKRAMVHKKATTARGRRRGTHFLTKVFHPARLPASPNAPGLMLSKSRNVWREISKEHRPGSALRVRMRRHLTPASRGQMSKSAQTERAAERSHETDRRVLQIANRVSATIGMEFFRSIVEHVAEVLPADCVYIGEFVGGQTERVKALAAWPDMHAGMEHQLAGSASAQVALGKPCLCRANARDRFPDDPLLAKLSAEACAGIPLLNSGGHSLGLIMTLYRNAIADPEIPKAILEAFADRAAAELERKQRGELLRQSEERHRAFVALNPDALWRIEFEPPVPTDLPEEEQLERIYSDGYLAECNQAMARLMGVERGEELICRPIHELDRLSNPSVRNATLHAIRSGYRFSTVETGPFGRDGKVRYMLRSQWGIVEDGMLRRIWGCTREITDLKVFEMAFDASEQRMLHLMENLPLMVVMLHPDGKVAFCNDHLLEFTGWRLADVLEKNWVDLMIPDGERGRVRAAIAATNEEPRRPVHFESPLAGPAGDHRWIAWDSTSLRDSEGRNAMTANLGRDITDFKNLETRFHQAQKLESVGRLAGGLARDFNKLLTVISSSSEKLLEEQSPSDRAYTALSEIRRAAEKGVGL